MVIELHYLLRFFPPLFFCSEFLLPTKGKTKKRTDGASLESCKVRN